MKKPFDETTQRQAGIARAIGDAVRNGHIGNVQIELLPHPVAGRVNVGMRWRVHGESAGIAVTAGEGRTDPCNSLHTEIGTLLERLAASAHQAMAGDTAAQRPACSGLDEHGAFVSQGHLPHPGELAVEQKPDVDHGPRLEGAYAESAAAAADAKRAGSVSFQKLRLRLPPPQRTTLAQIYELLAPCLPVCEYVPEIMTVLQILDREGFPMPTPPKAGT